MDIKLALSRFNSLQNNTKKSDSIWKPAPGKSQIRIVPYKFNKDLPFIELYFHYNINNKTYLSPMSFGRPDPIVEFAEKLKRTGDTDDWKAGKKMEPKLRTFVPVIVRGKENEGVKFWGFGKTVYQDILGYIADPDYGDISDPTAGRDITVEFKTKDQTGKDFPETSIRVKPNQTPVTDNKAVLEKIKNQPKITEVFKEPTYEELTKMLHNWLDPETSTDVGASVDETSAEATAKPESKSAKSKVKDAAPIASTDDVATAFDSLFNN